MSAITLILLLAVVVAAAATTATAYHVRGLRREVAGLREEVLATRVAVPAARNAPAIEEVRTVVVDALAEERERELAEARAFWAAQDSRDELDAAHYAFSGLEHDGVGYESAVDYPEYLDDTDFRTLPGYAGYEVTTADAALLDALLGDSGTPRDARFGGGATFQGPESVANGSPGDTDSPGDAPRGSDAHREGPAPASEAEHVLPYLPRQTSADEAEAHEPARPSSGPGVESAERRAARRRHPSDPNYSLTGEPVLPTQAVAPRAVTPGDHEHTIERLGHLATEATVLSDVRSGPLGTLDVYVFADDTTVCLTPGHRETAERLSRALDEGETPTLLGGSGVSGAYALTFACGEETVYVLADRVIASR